MKAIVLAAAGLIFAAQGALAGPDALYKVTFNGTWTAATHPMDYPAGAHYSGLIGATHNGDYVLFRAGGTASDGLERLSEAGAHSPLDAEIRAAIRAGKAGALIESRPIFNPPGAATTEFRITDRHPMVSLVAMIAPSPDWFAGVADLPLQENGKWVMRKAVTVYAWDAGTDSGASYASADEDTLPRAPIARNAGPHFMQNGKMVPVGELVFEKTGEMPSQLSSN